MAHATLCGMRPLLVTAGATRNPLDAIRYLSAHSTGATGVGIAAALAPLTEVLLLGSAEACLRATMARPGLATEEYHSTRDLMVRMERWVRSRPDGVVVHAAAVGDYEAAEPSPDKTPSGLGELVLRLRPTPKIVDEIRVWSSRVSLVSFKAAAPGTDREALHRIAAAQRQRTGSELVFANTVGRLGDMVSLVDADGPTAFTDRGAATEELIGRLRVLISRPGE